MASDGSTLLLMLDHMLVKEGCTSWHLDDTFEYTKVEAESFRLLDCSDGEARREEQSPSTFDLTTFNREQAFRL